MITTIDISPLGDKIVFMGKKILKCKQKGGAYISKQKGDIYIYDIKNKCIVYSHESDNDEHSPSFSKDGSNIVYSSRKIEDADDIKDNITHLRIVDLNNKTIEEITRDSYNCTDDFIKPVRLRGIFLV